MTSYERQIIKQTIRSKPLVFDEDKGKFTGQNSRALNQMLYSELQQMDFSRKPVLSDKRLKRGKILIIVGACTAILFIGLFILIYGLRDRYLYKIVDVNIYNEKLKLYKMVSGKDIKFVPTQKFLNTRIPEHKMGCYIHHNITKDTYYVGQSHNIGKRAKKHFKPIGGGNGDIYFDYKSGDKFESAVIIIKDSSTNDELNQLERALILKYHCVEKGYNTLMGTSSSTEEF